MSDLNNTDHDNRKTRVIKSGLNAIAGTVLFLLILIGAYWLAGKSHQRADLTRNKMYTLSDSSRNLLKKLQDRVTVTIYATEKDTPPDWTEKRNELRELMSQYRNISEGKIQYTFRDVSPGSESAKAATDAGMEPSLMQESSTTSYKINQGFFGLQAEYKGKSETIPFIDPNTSLEYQLTRVINKVAAVNIPKIGVVAPGGNPLMGQPGNFTALTGALQEEGFEVSELQPTQLKDLSKLDMLMLIDPQNLSDEALYHIDQYVMNGGKMFVAAPGVQLSGRGGMESVVPNPPNINKLLESYGLRIDPTIVEDWQGARPKAAITRAGTMAQYKDPLLFTTANRSEKSNITKNIPMLLFAYTSSVSRSDHGTSAPVTSLVQSSDNSRIQEGEFTLEPTELKPPTAQEKTTPKDLVMMVSGTLSSHYADSPAPALTNDDGTTHAVDEASIAKKSKPSAEVIVMGSALMLVNQALQQIPTNALLPLNAAEALTRGSDVLSLRAREPVIPQLRKITPAESMWTQVLVIGGIPLLLILFGFFNAMMIRRRKARYRRMFNAPQV
jgi:gliding-associated putative ABC transporter substrate-binding component GldG